MGKQYVSPLFCLMEANETLDILKQELEPILKELNAEIVELNLYRADNKFIVRLLADKEGGITMDDCALINKRLGYIIEEKSIIYDRYILEVNSPGLDRPLKVKRDFERVNKENQLDFWLKEAIDCKIYYSGSIKIALDEKLVIVDKEGKEISIPYNIIAKAKVKLV